MVAQVREGQDKRGKFNFDTKDVLVGMLAD